MPESCLYVGTVVHKRLRPKPHAMSYRVFSLFIDLDRIDAIARSLRMFSRNRFNAMSFFDLDHGSRTRADDAATGGLAADVRATFTAAGLTSATARVFLLCYPRVFGYSFNPIAVYYGYDADGRLQGAIYEVNNTFGERHSYVVPLQPTDQAGQPHVHGCRKELYVSPFTEMDGRYSFRLTEPGDDMVLAVLLRDAEGALLKTHYRADRRPLTDAMIMRLLASIPLVTLKVTAGIHYEALRLWLKGVPLTVKPAGTAYSVSHIGSAAVEAAVPLARNRG